MYWNYEYEDIVQKIKNNRSDKSYCKRYINSFFDSILNELSISAYVFQNDWQKIRAYKSLQYDRRRSFNLLLGSAYTIHQNCNDGVDILQKSKNTQGIRMRIFYLMQQNRDACYASNLIITNIRIL